MAKLTLQQTLDKSLKTAKQYVDTELAKKADSSHTHSYLPLTGGTVSGAITSTIGGGQGGFIISNSTARTMLYASSNVGEHIFGGNNDGTNQVKDFVRVGTSKLKYETGGNVYDIYHAGNKPSLSALGAAAASHGHTNMVQGDNASRTTDQNGNANDITQSGFYRPSNTASTTNPFPDGMHSHILHGQHPSSTYAYQIGVPFVTHNKIYFRSHNGTSWSSWNKIYHSGDKPTPADIGASASGHTHSYLPLSGGTLTNGNFGALTITRSGSANGASIKFANSNGDLGYIGMRGAANEGLIRWSADTTAMYPILDTSNFKTHVTPSAIGAAASSHGTHLTIGTGASNAAAGNHTHNYANKFLSRDEYTQITVNGDANKYYPVLLSTSNVSSYPTIIVNISRTYSWTAPSTWNTSTHKGGLTFTLEWNCSKYWDGNGTGSSNACYVTQFLESYCTMVAGLSSSTSGIVVWLRGGGALYQINSSIGKAVTAEVKLEGFTDAASQTFSARDYNATTVDNEIKKRWVNRSTSGVYDNNNRVYSAANPQTTINGLSFWTGTQAQYNALSSKSSTTVYFITG